MLVGIRIPCYILELGIFRVLCTSSGNLDARKCFGKAECLGTSVCKQARCMSWSMLGNRRSHKTAQGRQLRIAVRHTPLSNQRSRCPGTGSRTVEPHTLAHRPHRRLDFHISMCIGGGTVLDRLRLRLMHLKNRKKVRNFREVAVIRKNLRM